LPREGNFVPSNFGVKARIIMGRTSPRTPREKKGLALSDSGVGLKGGMLNSTVLFIFKGAGRGQGHLPGKDWGEGGKESACPHGGTYHF